jgi:alkylhydroperoxidase family enzyme
MTAPSPYNSEVTLPLPNDDAIRAAFGPSCDPKSVLNNIRTFAGTEDLAIPAIGLIRAMFGAQGISPKIREMIILRAAKVRNAPYVWQVNVILATNTGLTPVEIQAAAADEAVKDIAPEYLLVCRATDELCSEGTLRDSTLHELISHFDDVLARKVVLMIAFYDMVSLFLNGCRVPMEQPERVGNWTTPLDMERGLSR